MPDSLFVNATGMVTSVGLNTLQTYCTVKAGLSRIGEIDHYDSGFQPYVMSTLPTNCLPKLQSNFEHQLSRVNERRIRLAMLAAEDLKLQLKEISITKQVPFFLGWPEQEKNQRHVLELLVKLCDLPVDLAESHIYCEGRASGLTALKDAWDYLENNKDSAALVGAADSYKSQHVLKYLDQECRIRATGHTDCFIPGEGAGFLLLTCDGAERFKDCPHFSRISSMATGFEKGHFGNDELYTGEGLSQCIGSLLRGAGKKTDIGVVYSSMNGEHYWSKEWGTAYLRNKEFFEENFETNHPAEFFGDVGAASGLIMTGLATLDFYKNGYAKPIVIYASSDHGQRAAVLLESVTASTKAQI